MTRADLKHCGKIPDSLIHVFYLCIDNCIIQLTMEFISANLVYSKCLFLIYCFCSFIMSAIKGDILDINLSSDVSRNDHFVNYICVYLPMYID